MSFATEKEKQASDRFMFIRFEGRIQYSSPGSPPTPVTFAAHKAPVKVWREKLDIFFGYEIFEVVSFTYTNGVISFSRDAPDTGNYWADYQEFLTGNITRYEQTTPATSGDVVEWKPLIDNYPLLSYSNENITSGIISINASTVSIINEDNFIGKYLAGNASLFNRELKIWLAINDQSTARLVFSGVIGAVSLSDGKASIQILDGLNNLNKTAVFKNGIDQLTANQFMFPAAPKSITPKDVGRVLTRHLARRTVYGYGPYTGSISDPKDFYNGICSSYSPVVSRTTNREWLCGVLKYDKPNISNSLSIAIQGFGSVVRTIADGFKRYFFVSNPQNLYYGNSIQWFEGGSQHGVIVQVGNFTHLAQTYNLAIFAVTANVGSLSTTFAANPAFAAYFKSGLDTVNLLYGRDFTITHSVGQGHITLTLTNDFENSYNNQGQFLNTAVDPNADTLSYHFHTVGDLNHATVLKAILEAAGLTTNAASFTAAASALNLDVCFSIPFFGDGNLSTYADYASKILESTAGYLTVNAANEIEYKLYAAPSASASSLLDESVYTGQSVEVQYQDIYTRISATNKHFKDDKLSNAGSYGTDKSILTTNIIPGFLNEIERTKFIEFVTENLTNTIDRILKLNSNRRAKIKMTTATKNLDSNLGDDVKVTSGYLPGDTGTTDFKIVTKLVNGKTTEIEALDLYGVT